MRLGGASALGPALWAGWVRGTVPSQFPWAKLQAHPASGYLSGQVCIQHPLYARCHVTPTFKVPFLRRVLTSEQKAGAETKEQDIGNP